MQQVHGKAEAWRRTQAVAQAQQGQWMAGEGVEKRKNTWKELWEMEAFRMSFTVKSAYDVLTSPVNKAHLSAPRPLHMVTQICWARSSASHSPHSTYLLWFTFLELRSVHAQVPTSQLPSQTIELCGTQYWHAEQDKLLFFHTHSMSTNQLAQHVPLSNIFKRPQVTYYLATCILLQNDQ